MHALFFQKEIKQKEGSGNPDQSIARKVEARKKQNKKQQKDPWKKKSSWEQRGENNTCYDSTATDGKG